MPWHEIVALVVLAISLGFNIFFFLIIRLIGGG